MTFRGIVSNFNFKYIKRDLKTMSERTQKTVAPYMTMGPCSECKGARLSQAVLKCKINGYNIAELANMEITELIEFVKTIKDPVAKPIVNTLVERLQHLVDIGLEYFEIKEVLRKLQAMSDVGLDYLSLGQPLSTLSGGECQRIKLASELHKSISMPS